MKVPLKKFHLNGKTIGYHPEEITENLSSVALLQVFLGAVS